MTRQPKIIYKDKNLVVLNKPAGLLVHPIKKFADENSLVKWLVKKYPEVKKVGDDPENRPGIVHRLDQDTSGVMVVARNQKTFEYLKKLFQNHEIKKVYQAMVWGEIKKPSGIIDRPLGLKSGTLKRTTRTKGTAMIKDAITIYRVLGVYSLPGEHELFTLVEAEPKTGRTHQIRVHLASIGHPIVGDAVYTTRKAPKFIKRQFLHAESLELTMPNGKKMHFSAKRPPDLDLKQFSPVDRR
ncbi:MAG: RluA family pseudouridine synthase [bacterium]|nr:RluA family pseudouridine synthase [bacterium]